VGFPHYILPGKLIRCGLPSLRSSRYTHCAWAGGTFFQYLIKNGSSSAFTLCVCIAKIRLVIKVDNM
jgi:hypothetical protein